MRWVAVLALVLGSVLSGPGQGRAQSQPEVRSPVLTIDSDRVFNESQFGQRVIAEALAARDALAAENRRIEADLTAEEQSLTTRRPNMTPAAFRAEAAAFDTKVQGIRRAQDAKERNLSSGVTSGRELFFSSIIDVLKQMMAARGAAVILDRRAVFLGAEAVDITDEAILAIDSAIGDGSTLIPPPVVAPAPQAPPTDPAAGQDLLNDPALDPALDPSVDPTLLPEN